MGEQFKIIIIGSNNIVFFLQLFWSFTLLRDNNTFNILSVYGNHNSRARHFSSYGRSHPKRYATEAGGLAIKCVYRHDLVDTICIRDLFIEGQFVTRSEEHTSEL